MRTYPFIDMHIHLFNGHYLPLDGIFRSWGVPGILARPLAVFFNAITKSSDFSSPDDEESTPSAANALLGNDQELFDFFVRRLSGELSNRSNVALLKSSTMPGLDELTGALEDIVHQYKNDALKEFSLVSLKASLTDALVAESPEDREDFETVREAIFWALQEMELSANAPYLEHHGSNPSLPDSSELVDAKSADKIGFRSAWNVVRFVGTLLDTEREIIKSLKKDYSTGGDLDYPEPEVVLNIMMDMEKAYDGFLLKKPEWEFLEQILRMEALTKENSEWIVTFAAVDPHRENWDAYINTAISRGITGFKFYPPMGYRPINIPTYKVPVDPDEFDERYRPEPNTEEMNERVRDILAKCNAENLRLFAHCTPSGFEAFKGSGLNADPKYWDAAIKEYDLADLWLCLGHGGGTRPIDWHGWAARSDDEWQKTFAHRVIEMCREHKNVYCDLGYLLELFDDNERKLILSRLKLEILNTSKGNYPFHTKIMYGSDWHMKSIIGLTREYLNIFYAFFEDPDLTDFAEGFFSRNAKRFLGLDETLS